MRPTPPADGDRRRTPVRCRPPARGVNPSASHGDAGCVARSVARLAAPRNAERAGRQAAAVQASTRTASRCLPRRIPHSDRPHLGGQGEGPTGPFAGRTQRGKRGEEPGHTARWSNASGLTKLPADPAPIRCQGHPGGAPARHAIQSRRVRQLPGNTPGECFAVGRAEPRWESLRGRIAPLFPMRAASLDGDAVGGGSAPVRPHANLARNAVTDKFA